MVELMAMKMVVEKGHKMGTQTAALMDNSKGVSLAKWTVEKRVVEKDLTTVGMKGSHLVAQKDIYLAETKGSVMATLSAGKMGAWKAEMRVRAKAEKTDYRKAQWWEIAMAGWKDTKMDI